MSTSKKPRNKKLVRDAEGVAPDGSQYLWGLGLDEEHISVHGLCRPTMRLEDVKQKGREAAELEKLGDGDLRIHFSPGSFYDDDKDAANHLFHVGFGFDFFEINLDDRIKTDSPCFQLVDRLREYAEHVEELANRIDGILLKQAERSLSATSESEATNG